jgi:hypothetical protein
MSKSTPPPEITRLDFSLIPSLRYNLTVPTGRYSNLLFAKQKAKDRGLNNFPNAAGD